MGLVRTRTNSTADTFNRIIAENASISDQASLHSVNSTATSSSNSTSLLKKAINRNTNTGNKKGIEESYVSPFRGAQSKYQKRLTQVAKSKKFPTTSANSIYTTKDTKELGFKTIDNKVKRVKDISFPAYLTENEIRQVAALKDLDDKEDNLQLVKDSQKIIDLRRSNKKRSKKKTDEPKGEEEEEEVTYVDPRVDKTNRIAVDYDWPPPFEEKNLDENLEDAQQAQLNKIDDPVLKDYVKDAFEIPKKETGTDSTEPEEPETEDDDEVPLELQDGIVPVKKEKPEPAPIPEYDYELAQETIDENQLKDAKDLILQNQIKFGKPIDPSLAPKVWFDSANNKVLDSDSLVNNENEDSLQITHPKATPENPEILVRIDKYGVVSKAINDQVRYLNKVQKAKMQQYELKAELRLKKKHEQYLKKFDRLKEKKQKKMNEINELKLDKILKSEIIEDEKIRQLFEINAQFIKDKFQVLKTYESLRNQKISELKVFTQRQTMLQSQLNELDIERDDFQDNYFVNAQNLTAVSEVLDGQLFKLKQVNLKQDRINREIGSLEQERQNLNLEMSQKQQQHEVNQENIDNLKAGTHKKNIQLNNITNTIEAKMAALALVKQEITQEKLNLISITNEIELEKQRVEKEWTDKYNENTKNYEEKLVAKDVEMENKLNEANAEHVNTVEELKKDYDLQLKDLQIKAKEEADARLKVEDDAKMLAEEKLKVETEKLQSEQEAKFNLANLQMEKESVMGHAEDQILAREEMENAMKEAQKDADLASKARLEAEKERIEAEKALAEAKQKTTQIKLEYEEAKKHIDELSKKANKFEDDSLYSFGTEEEEVFR